MSNRQPTVFISYSHKDEEWKDRLVTHLGVLEKQGLLDVWDDRKIGGGDDWRNEIERALNSASVAILMITANFLNSDFILKEEVPRLLERRQNEGVRVIPLIVRPCVWDKVKWLKPIQARPKDGRALSGGSDHQIDVDLAALTKEVCERIARSSGEVVDLKKSDETNSVQSHGPESRGVYGRRQNITELFKFLSKKNIVTVYGMSGVGKSCLINEVLRKMQHKKYSIVAFPVHEQMQLPELYRLLAPSIGCTEESPQVPKITGGEDFSFLSDFAKKATRCVIHLYKSHLLFDRKGFRDSNIQLFLEQIARRIPYIKIILESGEEPPRNMFISTIYKDFHVRGLDKEAVISYFRRPFPGNDAVGWVLSEEDAKIVCKHLGNRGAGELANPLGMVLLASVAEGHDCKPVEVLGKYKEEYIEELRSNLFNDLYQNILNESEKRVLRACSLYRDYIPGSHIDFLDELVGSREAFDHLRRRCLLNTSGQEEKFYLHAMIAELTRVYINSNDSDFHENHAKIGQAWLNNTNLKGRPILANVFNATEAVYHLSEAEQFRMLGLFTESVLRGNSEVHLISYLDNLSNQLHSRRKFEENKYVLELLDFLQPDNAKTHNFLGLTLSKLKGWKHDDVLEHFKEAYRLSPWFPTNLANLGRCLLEREEPKCYIEIVEKLDQSMREKVFDDHCASIYCNCLEKIGEFESASRLRMERIEADSRDAFFYFDEATYLLESGKAESAMLILDLAKKNQAENDRVLLIRTRVINMLGNPESASRLRMKMIEARSEDAFFYNDEAKYLLEIGKTKDAMSILDLARMKNIEDEHTLSIRAKVIEKLGNPESASRLRMKMIESNTKNSYFYVDEAAYLLEIGKAESAMSILDLAKKNQAENDSVLLIRAKVVGRLGNPELASRLRMEMIKSGTQNAYFYVDEAKYLLDNDKADKAIVVLDLAKENEVEDDYVLEIRSKVIEILGDPESASRLRMEMIESGTQNAYVYADEAKYLLDSNKAESAMVILDLAKENEAEDDYILEIRSRILGKFGDS